MLLRLAYLAVTHGLAMLRLLPMSDRAKDVEILALRHQLTVLERQLGGRECGSPQPIGCGGAQNSNPAGGVLDDREDVDTFAGQRYDFEEETASTRRYSTPSSPTPRSSWCSPGFRCPA